MKKTHIILVNQSETRFEYTTSPWERTEGDVIQFEGERMTVLQVVKDRQEGLNVIKAIKRIFDRQAYQRRKAESQAFRNLLLQSGAELGFSCAETEAVVRSLIK